MKHYAQNYGDFFQTLTKEHTQEHYEKFFDANSTFEDPFQKVQGTDAIYKVFAHMYKTLYEPQFKVSEVMQQDLVAYLKWDFTFRLSPNDVQHSFEGVSRVEFGEDAKVLSHVDYWDAAFHVYEKIPLVGGLLRLIKRRLHA